MPDGTITLAQFEPLVGSVFTLQLGEAGRLTARLIEAKPGQWAPPEGRAPFSLMFEAPEPALPQRIYRLEHAQMGSMDIFLVPIARTATGVQYEAVFG
ncbi:DUF6916 family protein [Pelomonas cellulosilytica]|uniref:DUF6916 domain-containing protein n=1 Tax=Pelomonas cellulosilytica TaxID=2906762 RepID=A0ABS8XSI7_9BURK|nr:hypothetical protein [Pelomonas sp. P8]MCE4554148.1 hypothetical protein [Pelomonas sp. P8]